MANRRFGWHSGTLKCKDIVVQNDLSITGDLSFGDASTDTLTVTGTLAVTGTESVATGIAAVQMTSDGTTAARAIKSRTFGPTSGTCGDLIGVYALAEMQGGATTAANSTVASLLTWTTVTATDSIGTGNVIAGIRVILDDQLGLAGIASGTNSALIYCNQWANAASSIDFGVAITQGAATTMGSAFFLDAAGTAVTNVIEVDNTGNTTNFANFDAQAGCVADASGESMTVTEKIAVVIGANTRYIQVGTMA